MIILARAKSVGVLFRNKEEGGSHRGFRWSYVSLPKVFFDEFVQFHLFSWSEGVDFAVFWDKIRFQLNGMVPWSRFGETFGCRFLKYCPVVLIGFWKKVVEGLRLLSFCLSTIMSELLRDRCFCVDPNILSKMKLH
jgi:hypothetical protein